MEPTHTEACCFNPDVAGIQVVSPACCMVPCAQGLKLQQRRFCSWGLLDDSILTKLLAAAASTPGQALPTPAAMNSSQGGSGALLCPASLDGQDRAVPWTPLYLAMLADTNAVNGNNTTSSVTTLKSQLSCGQWVVLMRDEQTAALPVGCGAAASGGNGSSAPGFILEGDGGWGVCRTLYPGPQRAALRQWVADAVQQAAREVAWPEGNGNSSAAAASSLDLSVVLAASKILQDQAALALSAFDEVPGAELWAVVQAAVNATVAAGASLRNGTAGAAGFGTVLYTLLAPLLPAVEVLSDRAGSRPCWMQQQVGCWVPAEGSPLELVGDCIHAASQPALAHCTTVRSMLLDYPAYVGGLGGRVFVPAASTVFLRQNIR